MALFNIFSDPELKARQDQLDGQWAATNAMFQTCDNTPSQAFPEFTRDLAAWRQFYDSGSDWSADSKHATDEWQTKLKDWVQRLKDYGCQGSVGSIGGEDITANGDQGYAGVKDNPPDKPPLFQSLLDGIQSTENTLLAPLGKLGIGVSVVVVILLIIVAYVLTRGKAEGYGVKLG